MEIEFTKLHGLGNDYFFIEGERYPGAGWPALDKSALSVVTLRESGRDLEFWMDHSTADRLRAVELQRQVVYGRSRATARLQRVLEIAECASR